MSSARQRRRELKLHSSSTEYLPSNESPNQTTANNELPQSISQDNLTSEIEKKKEGYNFLNIFIVYDFIYSREKDMNDLVYMLTATLQLPSVNIPDSNELPDSNKPIIENGYSQNKVWSSYDRTIAGPLHETNRLHQRCQRIRE